MLYLRGKKIKTNFKILLLISVAVLSQQASNAQREILNLYDIDHYPLQFGVNVGANVVRFKMEKSPTFITDDTVNVVEAYNNAGAHLGLSASLAISRRFQLRFNPTLIIADRFIFYRLKYKDLVFNSHDIKMRVASGILTFPFNIKFQSDRIKNFRTYVFAGGFFNTDLAANSEFGGYTYELQLKKIDYGIEGGLGFNFYLPYFVFSPEIKVSQGMKDLHVRNQNLKYSRVLDGIFSKSLTLTLRFEGAHF